jgi:hypothetical protein
MRVCPHCGKEYLPRGSTQKYCLGCRPIVCREQNNLWAKQHHKERRAAASKCYAANPEKYIKETAKWTAENPEKVIIYMRRHQAKHRTLGFNPLNSFFVGSEGHHINQSDVIYIPKAMHQSVRHNIWTGRNMEKINALAGAYLTEDWT